MCVGLCVDQLDIDAHLIAGFLDTAFDNVRHSNLLRDRGEIARFALILLRRSPRNHFQIRDLRQSRRISS